MPDRPPARAVAAAIAVAALACAPPRLPIDVERDAARGLRPPMLWPEGEDAATPAGGAVATPRTFRVRAYADADYRAQHVRWEEHVRAQLARAGAALEALFGARLAVVDVRAWDRSGGPNGPLADALSALVALDPARDVDLVVGFASSSRMLPVAIEQLGLATTPGHHFVLRGAESAEEAAQLRVAFHLLPREELDGLLEALQVHRETLLVLHEWAHTLGAGHDEADGFILSPRYDRNTARFSEASRAALIAACAPPAAAPPVAAVAPSPEPPSSGVPPLLLAPADAPPRPARTEAQRSAAADAARLNEAVTLFQRTGDADRAWELVAPLARRHPADARIQHWSCYLASLRRPRAPETQATCEAAARCAGALPEVHLVLASVLLERGHRRGAETAFASAEAALARDPDPGVWSYLAQLSSRAGACPVARRAAARVPEDGAARRAADLCRAAR